jgi:DUF4097 and DUF4098 domain-containing protein YvlB
MKTACVSLALFLTALAAAGCDVRVNDKGQIDVDVNEGGRAEDESTRTYPLAKNGQLELETYNGDIELHGAAAGSALEVHATRKVRAKTDEEARGLLKEEYSTIETAPNRVAIRTMKREGPPGFRRQVRVDYRINVPAGTQVTIKSENGSVTLNNVDGRFKIGSTNGHVEGKKVSGGADIETVNAGVVLEMVSVAADIRIRTVNGGVIMGLPKDANASVEAATINGGVRVNDTLSLVDAKKERQHLSAKLGAGTGPRIDLQTTNGGVILGGGEPPR